MKTPPTQENIRLTISVTPEVHAVFLRFAKASGMSIGRAMGEWLGDTIDAAEHVAATVEKARAAPALVARELHAYALGMADEAGTYLESIRSMGRAGTAAGGASALPEAGTAATPRPVIRGGNSTKGKRP